MSQPNPRGFLLIEGLIAIALTAIFITTITGLYLSLQRVERQELSDIQARFLSSGGVEATRSIRDDDASAIVAGNHGIGTTTGGYVFSGSSDVYNGYTRVVTVADISQDTFSIQSVVSNETSNKSIATYLTKWIEPLAGIGDWSNPSEESTLNISGDNNGWKVQTLGDYAYVIRSGGTPDFFVVDISDTDNPSIAGSVSLSGTLQNIAVSGDYAYVVSSSNSREFMTVDISTPASPTFLGSYNAPGNQNARGVYVVGNTAYMVRDDSGNDEIYVINVAVPAAPVLLGSDDLNNDGNDVFVSGNYAYVATDGNELEVVDISVPELPNSIGSANLSGGSNGTAIVVVGTTALLGRANGNIEIIDVSTPASPVYNSTYDANGYIRDFSLGNSDSYLFVGTDDNNSEFQVIDISTVTSPSSLAEVNISGDINGVAYSEDKNRAILVGDNNSEEVIIYEPQ